MSDPECHAQAERDHDHGDDSVTSWEIYDSAALRPRAGRSGTIAFVPLGCTTFSVFIDRRILLIVGYSAPIAVRIAAANAPWPAAVG